MTFELHIDKHSFPFHTIFMGMNRVREGSRSQTISRFKKLGVGAAAQGQVRAGNVRRFGTSHESDQRGNTNPAAPERNLSDISIFQL
jgi:hypothetical protein